LYKWSEKSVNGVKDEPAMYELYDESKVLIYIGSTGSLSERFLGYWSTNFKGNKCMQRTRSYRREYVSSEAVAKHLEDEGLREYEAEHSELPSCNKLT
jgi:excinuclease UvrABC nuclease subunit